MVALEADKQRMACELEASQREQQVLIIVAEKQLALAQAEQDHLHKDVARLRRELEEANLAQQKEAAVRSAAGAVADEAAVGDADALLALASRRARAEAEVEAARGQLGALRGELEGLVASRARRQEEAHSRAQAAQALWDAVQAARRRLRDAEVLRGALRERYLQAGQCFELAVAQAEGDAEAELGALQAERDRQRARYEKHRQRLGAVEADLAFSETRSQAMASELKGEDAEAARLRAAIQREEALRGARATRREREEELLHQQQARGETIPVALHQRLLEEQAQRFRERTRRLEAKLGKEVEQAASRRDAAARALQQQEAQLQDAALRSSGRRRGGDALFRAGARCTVLEVELGRLTSERGEAELALAEVHCRRDELAAAAGEASAYIERLEQLVGRGKQATGELQEELDNVEAAVAEAQEEADIASNVARQQREVAERLWAKRAVALRVAALRLRGQLAQVRKDLQALREEARTGLGGLQELCGTEATVAVGLLTKRGTASRARPSAPAPSAAEAATEVAANARAEGNVRLVLRAAHAALRSWGGEACAKPLRGLEADPTPLIGPESDRHLQALSTALTVAVARVAEEAEVAEQDGAVLLEAARRKVQEVRDDIAHLEGELHGPVAQEQAGLRSRLTEALSEVEVLEGAFREGLLRLDGEWADRCAAVAAAHGEEACEARAALEARIAVMRVEVVEARRREQEAAAAAEALAAASPRRGRSLAVQGRPIRREVWQPLRHEREARRAAADSRSSSPPEVARRPPVQRSFSSLRSSLAVDPEDDPGRVRLTESDAWDEQLAMRAKRLLGLE